MKPRPISVLHFTNTVVRAGAEEHILTLLRGFDRKLFRLCLVCSPQVAEKLQPDLPSDVELVPLFLERPSHLGAVHRQVRILRDHRVDIVHSHLFQSSRVASPLARLCGVPVVVETPHVREYWRQGWVKGSFFLDRLVGRCVDHYVAVSEANARYLVEEKGLPERKITVIHNGIDLTLFDPACVAPPRGIKCSLGFDEDNLILLVVARLEPQKGHHILLEALPAVRREFPRVRVVCVGEGARRAELEEQTRALGLQGSVHFAGFQSNVAAWLALADLTVLPSLYEGLPLAAIESLAMGKPVVATAVDGTPEVVVDGITGLTVPPGEPVRLAQAVCQLLREPEVRERLGRRGRQFVLEHFSRDQQVQKTQELYLRLTRREQAQSLSRR